MSTLRPRTPAGLSDVLGRQWLGCIWAAQPTPPPNVPTRALPFVYVLHSSSFPDKVVSARRKRRRFPGARTSTISCRATRLLGGGHSSASRAHARLHPVDETETETSAPGSSVEREWELRRRRSL